MAAKSYPDEFREEAVRLVRERGYSVAQVHDTLGVTKNTLYKWLGGTRAVKREATLAELQEENSRLRRELLRAKEERDILKKAAAYFASESR